MFSSKSSHKPRGAAKRFQRVALNIGAVLGSLCLIMTALTLIFGLKPLIFASGSMGPGIPTGSLGIAVPTPVEEISAGQIVSVINSEDQRITHRVIENTAAGLVLQGDANPVPDLETYQVANVDKLLFSIPVLGYVVSWLSQPWAFFAGGLLCAYLLYVAFRSQSAEHGSGNNCSGPTEAASEFEDPDKSLISETRGKSVRITSVVVAAVLVGTLCSYVPRTEVTQAAFTGSATASGKPVASSLPSVPGSLACETVGGLLGIGTSARISWVAPNLPSGAKYAVRVSIQGQNDRYLNVAAGTNQATFSAGLSLLGIILGTAQTFNVRVFVVTTTDGAAVTESGSNIGWSSPQASAPQRSVKYAPGLLLVDNFSCG